MATIEELEARLARVEDRLTAMQQQDLSTRAEVGAAVSRSSDASRLARGASADVTRVEEQWRSHNRLLEALRETQREQGERMALQADLIALREHVTNLRTDVIARFDQVSGGLEQIAGMLDRLGGSTQQD